MSVQDAELYIFQFLSRQQLQLVITEKIEVRRGKGLFYDFKYTQTFKCESLILTLFNLVQLTIANFLRGISRDL